MAENGFNAVERVSEFCSLPQEAPEEIPGTKPDDWPKAGQVGACALKAVTQPSSCSTIIAESVLLWWSLLV